MLTRRFKPYPAYKDSGVEWLGKIPADWEVQRLKFVAPTRISKVDAKPDDAVYVGLEHIESWTGRLLLDWQPETVDSVVCSFSAGDVLFGKLRPYLAKAACPEFDGVCTSEILAFRPTAKCAQSYLMFCLLNAAYIRWVDSLTYGTKMPRVSPEQVAGSAMPLPNIEEQHAIVAFLDRETARIDALVAKKERLIELLREKRAALITRAVTKGLPGAAAAQAGLDPNVPMKDSGVEWLGEIPAHWSTFRFKLLFRDIYRYPTYYDIEYVPDGVPEVRGEALLDGQIIALPDQRYISAETSKQFARTILQEGDLVISVRGTMGKVGLVLGEFVGANITANLLRLSPREDLASGSYLSWLMRSEFFLKALDKQSPQTTIQTITMPQLASIVLPIPGLTDQRVIAAFLNRETARIDALEAKVRDAIERLKEFRTALIAAAVTGKIDVRGGAEG